MNSIVVQELLDKMWKLSDLDIKEFIRTRAVFKETIAHVHL